MHPYIIIPYDYAMKAFHKLVINSFGDPDISPPYTETDKESHPLRFEQYQRIKFSTGKEGRDRWKLGTVSRLYYRESGWLPGYCAYQFQDDDGDYRFAPKDTDEFIRDAHGKGGRARRSPSVKKDVWFLFGRNCLHPRHVTWKGGDLGIADQSTFSAAESFIINGNKGLKESVLSQWKSLSKESRFKIVTKFAELVFKMREDFLKARITRLQVELLIPELYSKEGKERLVESGDMKLMMDLLDHACECGYCVEKACRENGIFGSLEERNISKLLVECKCPCPKVHTRESFIIDTNGRGYCTEGGHVVDGCFTEMWGSSRRFIIGNFFTNFGFFASSDFIAREEAGEGLIDSLARDLGKIAPLSSPQTPGITPGSSGTEQQMCNVCGKIGVALSRCSKCKVVFYCGREHQLSDWPAHKSQCRVIRKSREAQGM